MHTKLRQRTFGLSLVLDAFAAVKASAISFLLLHRQMQDYYRLLGLSRLATPTEIKQAYQRLSKNMAPAPSAEAQEHRQAVQDGYELLCDPSRRHEYDAWLSQQPDARPRSLRERDEQRAQTVRYVRRAAWILWPLLAACFVLLLDWCLPTQLCRNESLLTRSPAMTGASMSDQHIVYDVRTPNTAFRLDSDDNTRLNSVARVTVARTPLFHIVRHVSAPPVVPTQAPLVPLSGVLYNSMLIGLPFLLILFAAAGLWPTFPPERRLNFTICSVLLALLTGVIIAIA